MRIPAWASMLTVGLLISGAALAGEVDLSADADLTDGAALGSIASSSGDGTTGQPYTYAFTALGGGLNLDAYRLLTTDGDSFLLDMSGEGIVGTGADGISTFQGNGSGKSAGWVYIVDAGDISIGGIDAHANSNLTWQGQPGANGGRVTLGTSVAAVGSVRTDYIHAYVGNLTGTTGKGSAGDVVVYSTGDVLIEDSGGTAGDILTHVWSYSAGDVTIEHEGAFRAASIQTWANSHHTSGVNTGNVTINGDVGGNGGLGTLEIGSIDTSSRYTNYGSDSGHVTISGYSSVSIGSIDTYNNSNYNGSNDGGNVSITGIAGNIDITGAVNLDSTYASATDGSLHLEATNFGYITLADLDLTKISIARIDSDTGTSVTGAVAGFDISGSQTALRAPTGEVINYDPFQSANAYLGFGTYELVNLDNTGAGGYLAPALTSKTWAGDTAGVWSSAAFDAAGGESPTAAGELAVFDGAASSTTVSVEAGSPGPTVGAIRLAGGTAYAINDGGGTINLDAGGGLAAIVAGSPTTNHTINAPIDLASDVQLQALYAGYGMTINGAISGAAAVSKAGAGTVTLSGSSSYSGGTSIQAGVLLVGADVAAAGNSPLGTGAIDLAGGTLGASGTRTVHRDVSLSADSALGGAGNEWVKVAGNISGAYNLSITGPGFVSTSGTNTHASTTVDGGTLVIEGGSHAGPITVNSGAFGFTGAGTAGVVNVNGGQMDVLAAAQVGELNVNGGLTTLSADLTVTTVNVGGGTVTAGSNALVVSDTLKAGGATFAISGGDTFRVEGTTDASGPGKIVLQGGTLTVGGATAPTDSLQAHWSFDDSGDPGYDDSGNGYAGSLNNGLAWDAGGKFGGALSFDGGNDFMGVPINVSETAYGVSMWVKADADNHGIYAVVNSDLGSSHDRHIYLTGGEVATRVWNNETITTSGADAADGGWHHIVHTFGGAEGGQKIYVDGELLASGSKSNSDFTSQARINLGYSHDAASDHFDGLIDEVYIYTRALTADDVAALNNPATGAEVAIYDLAGNGTVAGSIEVSGTLSPGNSVGQIDVDGDLTLTDGAIYEWEVGDIVNVLGTLEIADGAIIRLTGPTAPGSSELLFTYTDGLVLGAYVFDETAPHYTESLSLLDDGNGNVYVTGGAAVPEPATLVLLGMGAAGLLAVRRRRR